MKECNKTKLDYIHITVSQCCLCLLIYFPSNVFCHSFCLFVCLFFFFLLGTSHGDERCSCYTFENDVLMSWPLAMASCKLIDKDLVVIETEREWKFLTKEIQTRKVENIMNGTLVCIKAS